MACCTPGKTVQDVENSKGGELPAMQKLWLADDESALDHIDQEWASRQTVFARKRNYSNPNHVPAIQRQMATCSVTSWNAMKDWGQHNVLTYDEVLEEAQTGDIILFDNDVKVGTCLISCLTRSDFDHVGIVVRFPGRLGLRMLEAVAPKSVMETLDLTLRHTKSGTMYYRKLRKKDGSPLWTAEQEDLLREKAISLTGRPYESNFEQILQAWHMGENRGCVDMFGFDPCDCPCVSPSQGGEEEDPESEQKLFCSECVAVMYKAAGLIPPNLGTFNYLPKDFSTDPHAHLMLQQDFELLPEKRIVRDKAVFFSSMGFASDVNATSDGKSDGDTFLT